MLWVQNTKIFLIINIYPKQKIVADFKFCLDSVFLTSTILNIYSC